MSRNKNPEFNGKPVRQQAVSQPLENTTKIELTILDSTSREKCSPKTAVEKEERAPGGHSQTLSSRVEEMSRKER
jgi:hypothetical protein